MTDALAGNIVRFAQVLRRAGLQVGDPLVAQRAVVALGVESKRRFYWALRSSLLKRSDQQSLFAQAFALFWLNPEGALRPPPALGDAEASEVSARLSEALGLSAMEPAVRDERSGVVACLASPHERLRHQDFESMSEAEFAQAQRWAQHLALMTRPIKTRRYRPCASGAHLDLARTLRHSFHQPERALLPCWSELQTRMPRLVMLCDISGSMARYARVMLHIFHGMLSRQGSAVEVFVFSTRLTPVTRFLRTRDVDQSLRLVSAGVEDWFGGTRIGSALEDFNRHWSRRCLDSGAEVFLITDALEREGVGNLGFQAERLRKSARRLWWLNPLLRYAGFVPEQAGAKALLPHVDGLLPMHNLASLERLGRF